MLHCGWAALAAALGTGARSAHARTHTHTPCTPHAHPVHTQLARLCRWVLDTGKPSPALHPGDPPNPRSPPGLGSREGPRGHQLRRGGPRPAPLPERGAPGTHPACLSPRAFGAREGDGGLAGCPRAVGAPPPSITASLCPSHRAHPGDHLKCYVLTPGGGRAPRLDPFPSPPPPFYILGLRPLRHARAPRGTSPGSLFPNPRAIPRPPGTSGLAGCCPSPIAVTWPERRASSPAGGWASRMPGCSAGERAVGSGGVGGFFSSRCFPLFRGGMGAARTGSGVGCCPASSLLEAGETGGVKL